MASHRGAPIDSARPNIETPNHNSGWSAPGGAFRESRPGRRMHGFPAHPATATEVTVEINVNGDNRRIEPHSSVADLLEQLGLAGKPVAVEVNLELIPREKHPEHRLSQGDRLEIVTLVGGG